MRNSTKNTIGLLLSIMILLVGCQSLPKEEKTNSEIKKQPTSRTENGVTIHPYQLEEIKRTNLNQSSQKLEDGQNIATHQKLLAQVKVKFNAKQYDEAEKLALQAQRIAPQSADNYFYLSAIALQRRNYKNAESLANRGLNYAKNTSIMDITSTYRTTIK